MPNKTIHIRGQSNKYLLSDLYEKKFYDAMVRLARVAPVGVPQHIIQRGNNRQACFAGEEDMKAYLNWLKELCDKYRIDVHVWVLMTNHIQLLCIPR